MNFNDGKHEQEVKYDQKVTYQFTKHSQFRRKIQQEP